MEDQSELFWEQLEDYDREILNLFHHKSVIAPVIESILSITKPTSIVADIGCGIGSLLPYLSGVDKVYAVDQADNMLDKAKASNPSANVKFIQSDIRELALPGPVDVMVSVMSLFPKSIMDLPRLMTPMLDNLKPGGHLIMVVGSFEARLYYSNLYLARIVEELGKDEKIAYEKMTQWQAKHMNNMFGFISGHDLLLQKFWIKEELEERLMSLEQLSGIQIEKIPLPWDTQFPMEPEWIKQKPSTWVWQVKAIKKV